MKPKLYILCYQETQGKPVYFIADSKGKQIGFPNSSIDYLFSNFEKNGQSREEIHLDISDSALAKIIENYAGASFIKRVSY